MCLHSLGVFRLLSGQRDAVSCLAGVFTPSFFLAEPYSPDVDGTGYASRAGAFLCVFFRVSFGHIWVLFSACVEWERFVCVCVVARAGVVCRRPLLFDLVWPSVVNTQNEYGLLVHL